MSDVPATELVAESKPLIIAVSAKALTEPEKEVQNKSITSPALTQEQKIQERIKKFGNESENSKLSTRAERFGIEEVVKEKPDLKLNDRAARFGVKIAPEVSEEALEKRAARFGVVDKKEGKAKEVNNTNTEQANKRKERFGVVNEEDNKKLKARSERFQAAKV